MFGSNFYTIKQAMDVALLRQYVHTTNIANASTPGYKRKYVLFEELLRENGGRLKLKTTHEKHIDSHSRVVEPKVLVQNGTALRNDGNNVDLDLEFVRMVENGLRYQVLSRLISNAIDRYNIILRGVR